MKSVSTCQNEKAFRWASSPTERELRTSKVPRKTNQTNRKDRPLLTWGLVVKQEKRKRRENNLSNRKDRYCNWFETSLLRKEELNHEIVRRFTIFKCICNKILIIVHDKWRQAGMPELGGGHFFPPCLLLRGARGQTCPSSIKIIIQTLWINCDWGSVS